MKVDRFYGRGELSIDCADFRIQSFSASGARGEVKRHGHELAHLLLLLNGGYVSGAQGAPDVTSMPAIVYNPAGTEHVDRFLRAGAFVAISFAPSFLASLDGEMAVPEHALYCENFEAAGLARRLYGHCLQATQFGVELIDDFVFRLVQLAFETDVEASPDAGLVARAKALLAQDAGQPASVRAIARALNVHPVYLARVFRRSERCTPCAYRTAARAARGGELLRTSNRAITEIALELGFADHAHFSRAFRAAWGVSPRDYRRSVA